jgi:hypothetical protein
MRRRLLTFVSTVVLVVLGVTAPALATKPGTDPDLEDGHKITICHVTNSATNPYVVITIDIAAWEGDGDERHSPDHHVNSKTGDVDRVWSPETGCEDGGPTGPTDT